MVLKIKYPLTVSHLILEIKVKVCDKVAETFITNREKPFTYLNLGADYPNT